MDSQHSATGHGPALLTDLEGRRPLVRPEDTCVFGFRDAEEQAQYGSQPLPPTVCVVISPQCGGWAPGPG